MAQPFADLESWKPSKQRRTGKPTAFADLAAWQPSTAVESFLPPPPPGAIPELRQARGTRGLPLPKPGEEEGPTPEMSKAVLDYYIRAAPKHVEKYLDSQRAIGEAATASEAFSAAMGSSFMGLQTLGMTQAATPADQRAELAGMQGAHPAAWRAGSILGLVTSIASGTGAPRQIFKGLPGGKVSRKVMTELAKKYPPAMTTPTRRLVWKQFARHAGIKVPSAAVQGVIDIPLYSALMRGLWTDPIDPKRYLSTVFDPKEIASDAVTGLGYALVMGLGSTILTDLPHAWRTNRRFQQAWPKLQEHAAWLNQNIPAEQQADLLRRLVVMQHEGRGLRARSKAARLDPRVLERHLRAQGIEPFSLQETAAVARLGKMAQLVRDARVPGLAVDLLPGPVPQEEVTVYGHGFRRYMTGTAMSNAAAEGKYRGAAQTRHQRMLELLAIQGAGRPAAVERPAAPGGEGFLQFPAETPRPLEQLAHDVVRDPQSFGIDSLSDVNDFMAQNPALGGDFHAALSQAVRDGIDANNAAVVDALVSTGDAAVLDTVPEDPSELPSLPLAPRDETLEPEPAITDEAQAQEIVDYLDDVADQYGVAVSQRLAVEVESGRIAPEELFTLDDEVLGPLQREEAARAGDQAALTGEDFEYEPIPQEAPPDDSEREERLARVLAQEGEATPGGSVPFEGLGVEAAAAVQALRPAGEEGVEPTDPETGLTAEELIAQMDRETAAEQAEIDGFIREHGETTFQAPLPGLREDAYAIFHRSTKHPGQWQGTVFDSRGPASDMAFDSLAEGIREFKRAYGLDLSRAEVSRPAPSKAKEVKKQRDARTIRPLAEKLAERGMEAEAERLMEVFRDDGARAARDYYKGLKKPPPVQPEAVQEVVPAEPAAAVKLGGKPAAAKPIKAGGKLSATAKQAKKLGARKSAAQIAETREAAAIAVGNNKTALRKRLQEAKSVLAREAKKAFGKGTFDFENKRLVSDSGAAALQWKLRDNPDAPESYRNQQTSQGTVSLVGLKATAPAAPTVAQAPPPAPKAAAIKEQVAAKKAPPAEPAPAVAEPAAEAMRGGGEANENGRAAWREGVQIASPRGAMTLEGERVTRPSGRPGLAFGPDAERGKVAADHAWDYYRQSEQYDPQADPPKVWRNELLLDRKFAEWLGLTSRPPAAPPAPKAAPADKQPWEMTQDEWVGSKMAQDHPEYRGFLGYDQLIRDAIKNKKDVPLAIRKAAEIGVEPWEWTLSEYLARETKPLGNLGRGPKRPNMPREAAEKNHRGWIERRLREGLPVPAAVLAEYPDLAEPAPTPRPPDRLLDLQDVTRYLADTELSPAMQKKVRANLIASDRTARRAGTVQGAEGWTPTAIEEAIATISERTQDTAARRKRLAAAEKAAESDERMGTLAVAIKTERNLLDSILAERRVYGVQWAERNVLARARHQRQKIAEMEKRLLWMVPATPAPAPSPSVPPPVPVEEPAPVVEAVEPPASVEAAADAAQDAKQHGKRLKIQKKFLVDELKKLITAAPAEVPTIPDTPVVTQWRERLAEIDTEEQAAKATRNAAEEVAVEAAILDDPKLGKRWNDASGQGNTRAFIRSEAKAKYGEQIEAAPDIVEQDGILSRLKDERHDLAYKVSRATQEYVTIEVPDDGAFTLLHSKRVLSEFLKRVEKGFTVAPKAYDVANIKVPAFPSQRRKRPWDKKPPAPPKTPTPPAVPAQPLTNEAEAKKIAGTFADTEDTRTVLAEVNWDADKREMAATSGRTLFVIPEPARAKWKGWALPEDVTYPNYAQVVPASLKNEATFSAADAWEKVRRAMATTGDPDAPIDNVGVYLGSDGELGVSAIGGVFAFRSENVPGGQGLFYFNPEYLLNLVDAHMRLGSDRLTLRWNDAKSAIRVDGNNTGAYAVGMPMRGAGALPGLTGLLAEEGPPAEAPAPEEPAPPAPAPAPAEPAKVTQGRQVNTADIAEARNLSDSAREETARPILDVLEAIEDTTGKDKAGIATRGGSVYSDVLDYEFTPLQLAAARQILNQRQASRLLIDAVEAAPARMEKQPGKAPPPKPAAPEPAVESAPAVPAEDPLEQHLRVIRRLNDGDITADELRGAFEWFKEQQHALRTAFHRLTKKELQRYVPAYVNVNSERKGALVAHAMHSAAQAYNPSDTFRWQPTKETLDDALTRVLSKATDETVKDYGVEVAKRREQHAERRERVLKDPHTIEEFRSFIELRGRDALSPEQAERFDELVAAEEAKAVPPKKATKGAQAAKKLHAVAANMRGKAEASLAQDRQTNTGRRARMAASAEEDARSQIQLADMLDKMAEAIETGRATHLSGVSAATHIETLQAVVNRARGELGRVASRAAKGEGYRAGHDAYEAAQRAPIPEILDHVEYPWPRINKGQLVYVSEDLREQPGGKLLGNWFAARAKETSEDSPYVFDDDVKAAKVKQAHAKASSREKAFLADAVDDYKRLQAMGIKSVEALRAALREFHAAVFVEKQAEDPLKAAERELVGRKFEGFDFFPTPAALADRMVEAAEIRTGMAVLDPSAGKGDILDAVKRDTTNIPGAIRGVEIVGDLATILEQKKYPTTRGDFLELEAGDLLGAPFDRIVMNPPFSKGRDVSHVRHAYDLLAPDGRLVAIMGNHAFFANDKPSQGFREWLEEVGGTSEELGSAFKGAEAFRQTGAASRLVIIDKAHRRSASRARAEAAGAEGPPPSEPLPEAPPGVSEDDIPLEVARGAHRGTSMVPERRAAMEQREYARHMAAVWESFRNRATTPEEQATARTEFERYRENWLKRQLGMLRRRSGLVSTMIAGPSGFPVASQRKKGDAYGNALNAFLEWDKRAQRAALRNIRPDPRLGVSADEADAVEQIQKKIDDAKALQETMKAANRIVRKKGLSDDEKVERLQEIRGITESTARQLLVSERGYGKGFPGYKLTNNSANIRRMAARIVELQAERGRAPAEVEFDGGTVVENELNNRIQILYDSKPSEEVRTKLKRNGFRWAPSEGAWQRMRNAAGRRAVRQVLGIDLSVPPPEAPAAIDEAGEAVEYRPQEYEEEAPVERTQIEREIGEREAQVIDVGDSSPDEVAATLAVKAGAERSAYGGDNYRKLFVYHVPQGGLFTLLRENESAPAGMELTFPESLPLNASTNQLKNWLRERLGRVAYLPVERPAEAPPAEAREYREGREGLYSNETTAPTGEVILRARRPKTDARALQQHVSDLREEGLTVNYNARGDVIITPAVTEPPPPSEKLPSQMTRDERFAAWQQVGDEIMRLETEIRDLPMRPPSSFAGKTAGERTASMNAQRNQVRRDLDQAKKRRLALTPEVPQAAPAPAEEASLTDWTRATVKKELESGAIDVPRDVLLEHPDLLIEQAQKNYGEEIARAEEIGFELVPVEEYSPTQEEQDLLDSDAKVYVDKLDDLASDYGLTFRLLEGHRAGVIYRPLSEAREAMKGDEKPPLLWRLERELADVRLRLAVIDDVTGTEGDYPLPEKPAEPIQKRIEKYRKAYTAGWDDVDAGKAEKALDLGEESEQLAARAEQLEKRIGVVEQARAQAVREGRDFYSYQTPTQREGRFYRARPGQVAIRRKKLLAKAKATPAFDAWLREYHGDEYAEQITSDSDRDYYLDDWMEDAHNLHIREDGHLEPYWLTPETLEWLGDTSVVLNHYTSDANLPAIRSEGLRQTTTDASRHGLESMGVYLTTDDSSTAPARGYGGGAIGAVGGERIQLEVLVPASELRTDENDADVLSVADRQFVVAHVTPEAILNLDAPSHYRARADQPLPTTTAGLRELAKRMGLKATRLPARVLRARIKRQQQRDIYHADQTTRPAALDTGDLLPGGTVYTEAEARRELDAALREIREKGSPAERVLWRGTRYSPSLAATPEFKQAQAYLAERALQAVPVDGLHAYAVTWRGVVYLSRAAGANSLPLMAIARHEYFHETRWSEPHTALTEAVNVDSAEAARYREFLLSNNPAFDTEATVPDWYLREELAADFYAGIGVDAGADVYVPQAFSNMAAARRASAALDALAEQDAAEIRRMNAGRETPAYRAKPSAFAPVTINASLLQEAGKLRMETPLLPDWQRKMVERHGEGIRPYLKPIHSFLMRNNKRNLIEAAADQPFAGGEVQVLVAALSRKQGTLEGKERKAEMRDQFAVEGAHAVAARREGKAEGVAEEGKRGKARQQKATARAATRLKAAREQAKETAREARVKAAAKAKEAREAADVKAKEARAKAADRRQTLAESYRETIGNLRQFRRDAPKMQAELRKFVTGYIPLGRRTKRVLSLMERPVQALTPDTAAKYFDEAVQTLTEISAIEERKRLKGALKKLADDTGIDGDYREQINKLLANARYQITPRSDTHVGKVQTLREFLAAEAEAGRPFMAAEEVLALTDADGPTLDAMDLEEMWTFQNIVQYLVHQGREKRNMDRGGRANAHVAARTEMQASIQANREDLRTIQRKLEKLGYRASMLPDGHAVLSRVVATAPTGQQRTRAAALVRQYAEAVRGSVVGYDVELAGRRTKAERRASLKEAGFSIFDKIEFLAEHMDGYKTINEGAVQRHMWLPVAAAEDAESELGGETTRKLRDALAPIAKNMHEVATTERRFGKYTFTPEKAMAIYANSRNEGNRERLQKGNKLSDKQIDAIVAGLTPEERQVVDNIMKMMDDLYDDMALVTERLTGIRPPREPFYFPIVGDYSFNEKLREYMEKKDLMARIFMRAAMPKGFSLARVGGDNPVDLRFFAVITNHFRDVIHYVTHLEPVRNVQRLIMAPEIKESMTAAIGVGKYNQLMPWLTDIANPNARRQKGTLGAGLDTGLWGLRRHVTVNMLGLSFTVSIKQAGSFTQTIEHIGLKYATHGAFTMSTSPRETLAFIREHSAQMRHRRRTWDRELREYMSSAEAKAMFAGEGKQRRLALRNAYFAMIQWVDMATTASTWMGAYQQEFDESRDHNAAVRHADAIVRRTQPTGAIKDLARVQRGGNLQKLFTMFYSHFANVYNNIARTHRRSRAGHANFIQTMKAYWLISILPGLFATLAVGAIGGGDDELPEWAKRLGLHKKHRWWTQLATGVVSYNAAAIPILGNIVSSILYDFKFSLTPADAPVHTLINLSKARTWPTAAKHATILTGYIFGEPARQVYRTVAGASALARDETNDVRTLMVGPRKKLLKKKPPTTSHSWKFEG